MLHALTARRIASHACRKLSSGAATTTATATAIAATAAATAIATATANDTTRGVNVVLIWIQLRRCRLKVLKVLHRTIVRDVQRALQRQLANGLGKV